MGSAVELFRVHADAVRRDRPGVRRDVVVPGPGQSGKTLKALYTCRPDLVGFVNGLPLVVIEVKKPGAPARAAFDENLTHYKAEIPSLFWYNALLIASNGTESRVGSLTADWERFFEWKRIEREDEPRRVSLEVMLRGTCDRTRLLDIVEALRMYDKVKKYWAAETQRITKDLSWSGLATDKREEVLRRLEVLTTTDMAVIVSPGQNEVAQMKKLGLDIEPHRRRMNESQPPLDEKFKDSADPLRLVFVCAMWLTGFDAPSCSTVYLDKPMRNHTLMQAIARANRVFPGKHSGVIVDYANVFASLEKALAIYGAGTGGANPVRDKAKLVEDLRQAVAEATSLPNPLPAIRNPKFPLTAHPPPPILLRIQPRHRCAIRCSLKSE